MRLGKSVHNKLDEIGGRSLKILNYNIDRMGSFLVADSQAPPDVKLASGITQARFQLGF